MYLKSQVASTVSKIFSLPPILAGIFLIVKIPEGLAWGIFSLAIGVAIWGYKYTLIIEKNNLKTIVAIYSFVLRTKIFKISEFKSIYLGVTKSINMGETASARPSFNITFVYKNPDHYMTGDLSVIKGFDINSFFNFGKRELTNKNYAFISKNIIKKISSLTGLPIKYSEEIEQDFVVNGL